MKTFWLSFTDPDRPKGQQFLGVCVVDVTEADATAIKPALAARFPNAQPGAEWVAAATRLSWTHGCNPGGEMAVVDVTEYADVQPPRNQLLSRAELEAGGWIDTEVH